MRATRKAHIRRSRWLRRVTDYSDRSQRRLRIEPSLALPTDQMKRGLGGGDKRGDREAGCGDKDQSHHI
jgi:hypothetical protein